MQKRSWESLKVLIFLGKLYKSKTNLVGNKTNTVETYFFHTF